MTQDEAFEIMKSGKNVFLTGPAGSGKTYLLNRFIEYLKYENIGVGITASTGIAATHMEGRTIHSWAGIEIKDALTDKDMRKILKREKLRKQFEKTKVLIIDEISMLDAVRLDLVDKVCRAFKELFMPFGGLQVIFCGDFFQLPPVRRVAAGPIPFAWKARSWKDLEPEVCYLSGQYRQDDDGFLSALNAIRHNEVDEGVKRLIGSRLQKSSKGTEKVTRLYTHNVDVEALNSLELEKLPDKEHVFYMSSAGLSELIMSLKKNCLAPERLSLKVGAKVMFVKNGYTEIGEVKYVNGTLGTIIDFDPESGCPLVETKRGSIIKAMPESWQIEEDGKVLAAISQIPLRLAWAITVHKSQGMSLDEACIDLSRCFEYGMGYVALSRLRSLDGLHLLGVNEKAYQVHPEISDFDALIKH